MWFLYQLMSTPLVKSAAWYRLSATGHLVNCDLL